MARQNIKGKISSIWPQTLKSNNLDKRELRKIIFSNEKEKKNWNNYYTLLVEAKNLRGLTKKKLLVYDVPLIYETKSEKNYDLILLANCNKNLQRKRVLAYKTTNSLFENIITSQLSFNEKIKFRPKIINTDSLKLFILIKILLLIVKIRII